MAARPPAKKKPKAKRKSPAKAPVMVAQPHGGALRQGGTNKGGTGRPPSEIRDLLRGSFADRIAMLEQIADGEAVVKVKLPDGAESETKVSASPADRLRALDMLAKYGLGTTQENTGKDGEPEKAEIVVRFVNEGQR